MAWRNPAYTLAPSSNPVSPQNIHTPGSTHLLTCNSPLILLIHTHFITSPLNHWHIHLHHPHSPLHTLSLILLNPYYSSYTPSALPDPSYHLPIPYPSATLLLTSVYSIIHPIQTVALTSAYTLPIPSLYMPGCATPRCPPPLPMFRSLLHTLINSDYSRLPPSQLLRTPPIVLHVLSQITRNFLHITHVSSL